MGFTRPSTAIKKIFLSFFHFITGIFSALWISLAQMLKLKPKLKPHNIEPWSNIKSNLLISYRTLYTPFDRAYGATAAKSFWDSLAENAIWFFYFGIHRMGREGDRDGAGEGSKKMSPWVHLNGILFDRCEKCVVRVWVWLKLHSLIHTCALSIYISEHIFEAWKMVFVRQNFHLAGIIFGIFFGRFEYVCQLIYRIRSW